MKKIIVFVLLMMFALTGCGNKTEVVENNNDFSEMLVEEIITEEIITEEIIVETIQVEEIITETIMVEEITF